jgi:hypothetical protein
MHSHFAVVALLSVTLLVAPVFAQPQLMPPPALDRLVQGIALYPDSLLSQVLAASTYWNRIPDAARWADAHHYLQGQALTDAITADQVPWDPPVAALALLDDDTTSPASRRLASAPAAPGTRPLPILGQASNEAKYSIGIRWIKIYPPMTFLRKMRSAA